MTSAAKILDRPTLLARRREWGAAGRRVVWTNGCFDLLHAGHLSSLETARGLGDVLVVGVNADASVTANKGPTRPIIPDRERAILLAGLACVDAVHVFDERTPEAVLRELQPEVHCKGAEYAPPLGRPVPEADFVRSYGGMIAYLPLVPGISTSAILKRITGIARAA